MRKPAKPTLQSAETGPPIGQTVITSLTPEGYSIQEMTSRIRNPQGAETCLRVLAILILACGYLQWFLPMLLDKSGPLALHLWVGGICLGAGFLMLRRAQRGINKAIVVNLAERSLEITSANAAGRLMAGKTILLSDIQSLYVKRETSGRRNASLNFRRNGTSQSVELLLGAHDELEELHKMMCKDFHSALDCRPRRVYKPRTLPGAEKTARPQKSDVLYINQGKLVTSG